MLKIIDGILETNDTPIVISSINNTLEVVGKYPATSTVYCYITGYTEEYKFPLVYNDQTDEGNIFKGHYIIHRRLADYMNSHKDKTFTIKFMFDNEPIEGEQKILINYISVIAYLNTLPDPVTQIMETVNKLSVKIDSYINNRARVESLKKPIAKIGMSPIAVDNVGHYVWDYPFAKEKEYIKVISKTLAEMSEELKKLNERVTSLEQKVLDHIYETYEL